MTEPRTKRSLGDYMRRKKGMAAQKPATSWSEPEKLIVAVVDLNAALPPMLSPTLPPLVLEIKKEENKEIDDIPLPHMLSPTLPPQYLQQPTPRRTGTKPLLDAEDDDIPVARLTPRNSTVDSFEKVEHLGVHSYRLVKGADGTKQFLLTLHVPAWYKTNPMTKASKSTYKIKKVPPPSSQNATASTTEEAIGLRITKRKSTDDLREETPKKKQSKSNMSSGNSQDSSSSHKPQHPLTSLSEEELRQRFTECLSSGSDRKHAGDSLKTQNPKLAIANLLDAIIIYLVGFYYQDQMRKLERKNPLTASWMSLVSLVEHVEKFCEEHNMIDMMGLSIQVKAVVMQHLSGIYGQYAQLDVTRRTGGKLTSEEFQDGVVSHMKDHFSYTERAKVAFIEAEKYLNLWYIQDRYPAVVEIYSKSGTKQWKHGRTKPFLNPKRDPFVLPVTSTVGIPEISAYAFRMLRQWCHEYKVGYYGWYFE